MDRCAVWQTSPSEPSLCPVKEFGVDLCRLLSCFSVLIFPPLQPGPGPSYEKKTEKKPFVLTLPQIRSMCVCVCCDSESNSTLPRSLISFAFSLSCFPKNSTSPFTFSSFCDNSSGADLIRVCQRTDLASARLRLHFHCVSLNRSPCKSVPRLIIIISRKEKTKTLPSH